MRVLVLDTYYQGVLDDLYASRPELAGCPYAQQRDAIMALRFGTSDAYSRELRALGHDAWETIANCEPLQRAWAAEHGPRSLRLALAARRPWRRAILRAQIAALRPDVLYCQDLSVLDTADLAQARAGGALIAGQIASAAPADDVVRGYDVIFTSFPHFVERFRALGVDSEYLAIGFDPQVLSDLDAEGTPTDPAAQRPLAVAFVGGIDPSVHPERVALIERLCARFDIAVWGYGVEGLAPDSPLRARHRGRAWGLDMYRALASARIVLNRHIPEASGYANNMRLFEATGVGALLATEAAPNLADLFAPSREVVAYAGDEELEVELDRLLADDEGRTAIASAGREATLSRHTYRQRMAELAVMLEERHPA